MSPSASHFSLFNCCLRVVLQLDKGNYPPNFHVVFCPINSILLNILCIWILLLKGDGELQAHNITHLFYSSVLRVLSEVAEDRYSQVLGPTLSHRQAVVQNAGCRAGNILYNLKTTPPYSVIDLSLIHI